MDPRVADNTYCLHKSCSSLFRFEFKFLESNGTQSFSENYHKKRTTMFDDRAVHLDYVRFTSRTPLGSYRTVVKVEEGLWLRLL